MNHLSVDIETRSSVDIKKAGAYKYAMSDDFEILLIAYKWNHEPVQIIDLEANKIQYESVNRSVVTPEVEQFMKWLHDPTVIKHAYNAAFEWWCSSGDRMGRRNFFVARIVELSISESGS